MENSFPPAFLTVGGELEWSSLSLEMVCLLHTTDSGLQIKSTKKPNEQ